MKISFNWLKEYVDIDISPEELAEKITAAGIEIEQIVYLNNGISNVVVAKVLKAEKHPNADKLKLCEVTTDEKNKYQVVCGAPNVDAGQKIPFALIGATLPNNMKIKKAKLRGIESQGMICSARELGLNEETLTAEQKEGILVLDDNLPLGKSIIEVLNLDDCIFELDLTPNRSDCLSVINVAREIAAILDKKVKLPEISLKEEEESIENQVKITIQDPDLCARYSARIVKNVKLQPSPEWLQHRLRCAGIRPINNVVDITNYVMLEMGQPLHAFDYSLLKDKEIIVRRAKKDEEIITLDGVKRKLNEEMLLITDPEKPIALAGVMGGENTEVTDKTVDVLIESAYFDPISVRKTSTIFGLRSESSIRFEKGINIETVILANNRAAQLMAQLADGEVLKGVIDKYPQVKNRKQVKLKLNKVNQVLGTNIDNSLIKNYLTKLNFTILEENPEEIKVEVPPYRADIFIEEDLIEEVARMYGYDNIPVTLPYGNTNVGKKSEEQKIRDIICDKLVALGLNEIVTYSFINKNNFDKILLADDDIRRNVVSILNPLSEEQGVMRTTLLPSLLETISKNISRRNDNIGIFELGKVYIPNRFPKDKELPEERWALGIAVRGILSSDWQTEGQPVDFYYLKGIVESLFYKLRLAPVKFKSCQDNYTFHPGRTADIYLGDELIGFLGEIHPLVAENYDILGRNYIAEIDIEKILKDKQQNIMYKSLPKFPGVLRDLAIVVEENIAAHDLLQDIKDNGGKLLKEINIFDVYQGNQIQKGYKSIAFSLKFQSEEKTLTDEEINKYFEKIQESLEKKFKAILRSK